MNGQSFEKPQPPVLRVIMREGAKEPLSAQVPIDRRSMSKEAQDRRVTIAVITPEGVDSSITMPIEALSLLMARVMGMADRRSQTELQITPPKLIVPERTN